MYRNRIVIFIFSYIQFFERYLHPNGIALPDLQLIPLFRTNWSFYYSFCQLIVWHRLYYPILPYLFSWGYIPVSHQHILESPLVGGQEILLNLSCNSNNLPSINLMFPCLSSTKLFIKPTSFIIIVVSSMTLLFYFKTFIYQGLHRFLNKITMTPRFLL